MPWILMNFVMLTSYIISLITSNTYVHIVVSSLSGCILTMKVTEPYSRIDIIIEVFRETLTKEFQMLGYLALTLVTGLTFILIT
jgi:hypothetical protein